MTSDQFSIINAEHEHLKPQRTTNLLPVTADQPILYEYQDGDQIQLRDYLDVILRRKWLILAVFALVFLSILIFTLSATRIYEASALIEVSQDTPRVTSFQEVLGSEIKAREFYETQVELLGNRAMINRVIEKLGLMDHAVIHKAVFSGDAAGPLSQVSRMIGSVVQRVTGEKTAIGVDAQIVAKQRVAEYILRNLRVTPSRKSMLIEVAFRSSDRHLSMEVVNALVEDFINWKMALKVEASSFARHFLTLQMDRAKINLEQAEEQHNAFAKHAGIVSLDARLNSIYRHLEELNASFAAAEADMMTKKAIYQQTLKDGNASLPRSLHSGSMSTLKGKYAELMIEYAELKETFHDDYPRVRNLKARMESLMALIHSQEQDILHAVKSEYQTAVQVVSDMEKRIEEQKHLVLDLNERAIQYSIMAREVEANEAIYQSLLQRAKEIESMAGVSSSNIQIVNRADLPLKAVRPNVALNLLLAVLLGLLGGSACAFIAEHFADTVTDPNEIANRFHIPLLGVIPQTKPDQYGLENFFLRHPRSPFAEAIRATRVSVQLSGSETRSKCFLVTSTMPSEGKTTVAVNLAMSFALAGERTVLIDADLRKPRLHEIFDLGQGLEDKGISSFLAGITNTVKMYNGHGANFRIISSGPVPPNPAELLASQRFHLLLKALSNRYDRIILDGPPHIGFADTLILSNCVGGIVLVSGMGEVSRDAVSHFKRAICTVNGTILGCIVNKVDLDRTYGYGGYYRSYRAYSDYEVVPSDENTQQRSVSQRRQV
jgi:polysaccharide biosynthesis transport protein